MSPKSSKPEIAVIGELPSSAPRTTPPAQHWLDVSAAGKEHEGQWIRVRIPHLSRERHKQVPHDIRRGELFAFREPGWNARSIDGELYVKFQTPTTMQEALR